MKLATTIACAAIALAAGVTALPKITRAGRYLYSEDGSRFYIKGVAYQEKGDFITSANGFPEPINFVDPLADPTACSRDVTFLQALGVNAIRVYSVDPFKNHDSCMSTFSNAGIYTIIDLSQPVNGSIDRTQPKWQTNLLNLYLNTVDAFIGYDNVLAFTVGNEIVSAPEETIAAPFIKAAARDVKAYLKAKGSSALVTYASTDGSAWRILLAQYLSCGDDSEAIDMYGLNNYEWKGDATIASYSGTISQFANYNVPAYFSEFGSNAVSPRPFTEVAALYSTQLSNIFSGGLAFAYFPTIQDGFALTTVNADGSITTNQDYENLKQQYTSVVPPNSPSMSAAGATQFPACAAPDGVNFLGSTTLPPTPNQAACDCAVNKAFSCVFTPRTANVSVVAGALLGFTCGELATQFGQDCSALSAFGNNGSYGILASCDPATQTSYVMSKFYEASNRNPQACSFAGNATVNTAAPATESAAEAAASSCLAAATQTFTPSGPAVPSQTTPGGSSGGSGTGSGGGSGSGSGSGTGTGAASRASGDFMVLTGSLLTFALGVWAVAL